MKRINPKVCFETTIPSYLTSRPSRDLQVAAHQQLTFDWWHEHRQRFELFISPLVVAEAGAGDSVAAARRLAVMEGISILAFTPEARRLAEILKGLASAARDEGYDLPLHTGTWESKIMRDPIVDEIHRIREEHAARFNYDLNAIFDDFERNQEELGLPLITLQPREPDSRVGTPRQPGDRAA